MRALFSAGVLDRFMEAGLRFDGAVGVSAGACFGCNFKSHQPGRALRYNMKYCRDPRYGSWRSWYKTGDLFDADFCYRALPEELDPFDYKAYREDPMAFWVVCTDVHTGRAHYQCLPTADRSEMPWMQASASLPMVSRPVKIGEGEYLDGGIADSIPLAWALEQGFDRCVVVLTQPALYRKGPMPMAGAAARALKKYPALVESLLSRHQRYNRALSLVEASRRQGKAFVLRPPERLAVGRCEKDPEKLRAVWQMGYTLAGEQLEELREFLQA